MRSRKNETPTQTVCFRCKQCKACFATMDEINHHLQKYNHFIRFSEEGSSAASAFPPLPVPANQVIGMASSSSDIDEGEREGRRRSTQNGSRNEVEGERNNNGFGDNVGGSRKSSLDGKTSPQKSYAESVKKKDNTGKPETEKSLKANLTEQNDIEDMETDTDKPQSPTYDAKSWPPVTSNNVHVDKMKTEPIIKSLPEPMEVLPSTETMTKPDASAHSPKKTNAAPTTPSSGNESVKNGTVQESKTGDTPTLNSVSLETRSSSIKVSNKDDGPPNGEDMPPATATRSALPQKKKNDSIRLNVRRRTEPSAAEPVIESGSNQPLSSKNVEKVNKGESLSASLTTMKAKLNHIKWRDLPTTAFTYSNQTQTSKSEENVPGPAATGKSNKNRYKCKYCDEWFMYPVQIISHVRREHKSISKTADSKFPISTNKIKKAEQDKESTTATTASTTTATKSGQSYPLRSLSTRTRRSTTDVNYTTDKKEKKSRRKPTKFTCRHCSQKFLILAYLKQHLHSRHPETVAKLNPEGVQTKKRKLKRFRYSTKRKIQQSPSSTTVLATSPSSSISVEPTATVPNPIPESTSMEVDEQLTASVEEANVQSQPKKRTMFSCKHCSKQFPLLNQLKIHLHQVHPEMMGKKKQNKIALNGDQDQTPVVTNTNEGERGRRRSTQNSSRNEVSESRPKATATRRSQQTKRQSRLSKEKEEPLKRQSTERMSPPPDEILEDVKPNLAELQQTLVKGAATNEIITIEDEPDCYEDTAESILAALTSKQSQTCPCCMKFFKFAGSLKNHLKVCTDEYFSSVEGQGERSQLEDAETAKVNIEDDDDDDDDIDDEDNNVESLEEEEEEEEAEDDEEEEVVEENSKIENNHELTTEDHQLDQLEDSNAVPYYKQLDYCRCWLCEAVVARFYNLKRHLFQVHKLKMTTNEIHTKQTQLLGIPSPPVKSKM